jgi:large subunit ribosomal protein L30
MADKLKITLLRSRIGRSKTQKLTLDGLGLRKRHQTVILEDTPAIRGMVNKLDFMLQVEEL